MGRMKKRVELSGSITSVVSLSDVEIKIAANGLVRDVPHTMNPADGSVVLRIRSGAAADIPLGAKVRVTIEIHDSDPSILDVGVPRP